MIETPRPAPETGIDLPELAPPMDPCVMLLFGASGNLASRLLVPALYNLACDRLLDGNFALLGTARDALTTEQFRERMSRDIKRFHTRDEFDQPVWDELVSRFYYLPGDFRDSNLYPYLRAEVAKLDGKYNTRGNVLFYLATAPNFFGMICNTLHASGYLAAF